MIDWLNRNQGFVMAALTLGYVIATAVMVRAMLASNRLSRQSLKAAQAMEKRRTRPYVFFDIEVRAGVVYAVLRNTGLSPALDVRVELVPPLTHNAGSSRTETGLTKHPHGFLAPGRTIEDFIDAGPGFFAAYPDVRLFNGTLQYDDVEGIHYSEAVTVDVRVHEDIFYTDHKEPGKELAKVAESLRRIEQKLK